MNCNKQLICKDFLYLFSKKLCGFLQKTFSLVYLSEKK